MSARVVLIDSGVNAAHPHVRGLGTVVHGPAVGDDGRWIEPGADGDLLGHGTAAAAAILDLAPGIELVSIRVFRAAPSCPFERVLEALARALALAPDVVNLSLGTTRHEWSVALAELVRRAVEAGVALVSPAAHAGLPSLPGALEGVHGVLMDATLARCAPERRALDGHALWYASPYPRDLPGLSRGRNLSGISMACANVSGHLAAQLD